MDEHTDTTFMNRNAYKINIGLYWSRQVENF